MVLLRISSAASLSVSPSNPSSVTIMSSVLPLSQEPLATVNVTFALILSFAA